MYYYDMENYDANNSACSEAVKSFLNGWGYQNRYVYGNTVGVYGTGCDAVTWPAVPNVPDDVWIADWNGDPDVWGLYCMPDPIWCCNQRLHQYAGNVWENYAGVWLYIDRDCANGLITPHGHGFADGACTTE